MAENIYLTIKDEPSFRRAWSKLVRRVEPCIQHELEPSFQKSSFEEDELLATFQKARTKDTSFVLFTFYDN